MDGTKAVDAFGALAHPYRLMIFKILIRQGPNGRSAGQIAEFLGVAPSSLSFHLGQLERAGLIRARRFKRQIFYAADIEGTRRLLAFLTEDCCNGHPDICGEMARLVETCGRAGSNGKVFNVLFLCTGNSARSVMAECILNREVPERFKGYSAGSHPSEKVDPAVLALLENSNFDTSGLRSKNWAEFATDDAPQMDFVFTVCDNAAGEICPIWPGQPMSAHWGVPDPVAFVGNAAEKQALLGDVYRMLANRISAFVNLPMASLDKLALQKCLEDIGAET